MFLNGKTMEECATEYSDKICQSFGHIAAPDRQLVKEALISAYYAGSQDRVIHYSERLRQGVSNIDPEAMCQKLER